MLAAMILLTGCISNEITPGEQALNLLKNHEIYSNSPDNDEHIKLEENMEIVFEMPLGNPRDHKLETGKWKTECGPSTDKTECMVTYEYDAADQKIYAVWKINRETKKITPLNAWANNLCWSACQTMEFKQTHPSQIPPQVGDEFVEIYSEGEIDLTNWKIKDEQGNQFEFPDGYHIEAGQSIRIFSGQGQNTYDKLFWNRVDSAWSKSKNIFITDQFNATIIQTHPPD
ncbi:MAG: lamin tail domain-containing protein [Candidatus Diapherotrites archaeon]|nr:lamin tail domain-containing protein [Candidatus Diapherotrites archaeon]